MFSFHSKIPQEVKEETQFFLKPFENDEAAFSGIIVNSYLNKSKILPTDLIRVIYLFLYDTNNKNDNGIKIALYNATVESFIKRIKRIVNNDEYEKSHSKLSQLNIQLFTIFAFIDIVFTITLLPLIYFALLAYYSPYYIFRAISFYIHLFFFIMFCFELLFQYIGTKQEKSDKMWIINTFINNENLPTMIKINIDPAPVSDENKEEKHKTRHNNGKNNENSKNNNSGIQSGVVDVELGFKDRNFDCLIRYFVQFIKYYPTNTSIDKNDQNDTNEDEYCCIPMKIEFWRLVHLFTFQICPIFLCSLIVFLANTNGNGVEPFNVKLSKYGEFYQITVVYTGFTFLAFIIMRLMYLTMFKNMFYVGLGVLSCAITIFYLLNWMWLCFTDQKSPAWIAIIVIIYLVYGIIALIACCRWLQGY